MLRIRNALKNSCLVPPMMMSFLAKLTVMKASELVPSNSGTAWMGLILGRKTFQRPMKDGVELFNDTQDVYLRKEVTVA